MDLAGKLFKVMPVQKGDGKNGTWQKMEFVIETSGQFPKKVCFSLWGDKVATFKYKEGDNVKVSFDIDSREFSGRWYTDAKAWKVEAGDKSAASSASTTNANSIDEAPMDFNTPANEQDDLPF